MFISYHEKKVIKDQIAALNVTLAETSVSVKEMESRLMFWEAKCRVLESKLDAAYEILSKPKKAKKPLTPEQRERQREYVRAYNARKRAEKAQQVAA